MKKTYTLVVIEPEGVVDPVLISAFDYTPDAGPHAGKHFRAAWAQQSHSSWGMVKNALKVENRLTRTTGRCAFQPKPIVVTNAYPTRNATAREFDYLTQLDRFEAEVTIYQAESLADGTAPAWSAFGGIFKGRIQRKPQRGQDGLEITFYPEPTQSQLETPLLNRAFSGMGGWFKWDQPVTSTSAPVFTGGNWTWQFYGTVYTDGSQPLFSDATIGEVKDSGGSTVAKLEFDIITYNFVMRVNTSGGPVSYIIGAAGSDVLDPLLSKIDRKFYRVVFSWDETASKVRAWFGDVQTVDAAMANPAVSGTEDNMEFFLPRANSWAFASSFRIYNYAVDESTQGDIFGPVDFPDDTLLTGYEFDIQAGETIPDYGTSDIDLITGHAGLGYADSDVWGGAVTSNIDGSKHLTGKMIPAMIGDCFNVPALLFDTRTETGYLAAAVSRIDRMYVRGVALVKDTAVTTATLIDPNAQTIRGRAVVLFGLGFVPQQRLHVFSAGTYDGVYDIEEMQPSPFRHITPTGSSSGRTTLIMSGLDYPSVVSATATLTSVSPNWKPRAINNPYTDNSDGQQILYLANFPQNATVDAEGDPTIVALNPPAETYVAPGDLANGIAQILTLYGLNWTGSQFLMPDYGDIDGRIGYFVADGDTSVGKAVDDVLKGHNAWLDEGIDGVSTLRQYTAPTGNPAHTISQGSVVSVKHVARRESRGEANVDALRVLYRKNWTGKISDPPGWADPDTREYIQTDYQELPVGDIAKAQDVPEFVTYEMRTRQAKQQGRLSLLMSKSDRVEITYRGSADYALKNYNINDEFLADLPDFDFPAFNGTLSSLEALPASGLVTVQLLGG